jgi:hypothetical protein
MKKLVVILLGISVLGNLSSCSKDKCLTGDEYRIGKERQVDPFTGIDVNLSAVVELVHDTSDKAPFVEFIVEGNLEEYIATPVVDGTLKIYLSSCFDQHEDIIIRVHYDTLYSISVSGPGDVQSTNILTEDSLELYVYSSGSIFLTTDIETVKSVVDGSGLITFNGQINRHDVTINGSGSVQSYNAMTLESNVSLNGSGSAFLRVRNQITGIMTGTGDLHFKNFPAITVNNLGTGAIISDN